MSYIPKILATTYFSVVGGSYYFAFNNKQSEKKIEYLKKMIVTSGSLIDIRYENKVHDYHPLYSLESSKIMIKSAVEEIEDKTEVLSTINEHPKDTLYIKSSDGKYTNLVLNGVGLLMLRPFILLRS